jgi:hypothetical protein
MIDLCQVFYDSVNRPGEVDMCGYCGKQFVRSAGALRDITKDDREERVSHVQKVHNLGECDLKKKFLPKRLLPSTSPE